MFKKILVPLDGSEYSLRALDLAVEIAKKFKAEITLINVINPIVPPVDIMIQIPAPTNSIVGPVPSPSDLAKKAQEPRKEGDRILTEARKKIRTRTVKVNTEISEGKASQQIIRISNEGNFDLIVIGKKGTNKLKELIVGSVSEAVIKEAPCPVLIVR